MTEHPADRAAYAVFADLMGWAATWDQLGPTSRSAFSAAFRAARAGHDSAPPPKSDRASGAEVLAHLRARRGRAST